MKSFNYTASLSGNLLKFFTFRQLYKVNFERATVVITFSVFIASLAYWTLLTQISHTHTLILLQVLSFCHFRSRALIRNLELY